MTSKYIHGRSHSGVRIFSGFALAWALVFALAILATPATGSAAGPSALNASPVKVMALHFVSQPDMCRVVVELEGHANYRVGLLKNPERLYIDFLQTTAAADLRNHHLSVGDNLLNGVRVGSGADSTTRVVLDLNYTPDYKIYEVENPQGLVIELNRGIRATTGAQANSRSDAISAQPTIPGKVEDSNESAPLPAGHAFSMSRTLTNTAKPQQNGDQELATVSSAATASVSQDQALAANSLSDVPIDGSDTASPAPAAAFPAATPASTPAAIQQGTTSGSSEAAPAPTNPGPTLYGSGDQPTVYGDNLAVRNILTTSISLQTNYTDNVYSSSQSPVSDESFLVGSSIHLDRETKKVSVLLDYLPSFLFYRQASSLNMNNQNLNFDLSYRASAHWTFRARTTASYTNGMFAGFNSDQFVAGLTSPSALNETLFPPTARQFGETARLDVTYHPSIRDSFTVYGSFLSRNFSQQTEGAQELTDTREVSGGVMYNHRLTPHDTVGLNYLYQDIALTPGGITVIHSLSLTYGKEFSPSITADAFGGPDYTCLQANAAVAGTVLPTQPQPTSCTHQLGWIAGGDLTKRTHFAAFQLTAQRLISDGGGLMGAVVNTSAGLNVSRKIGLHWNATIGGGYAENDTLNVGPAQTGFQSEFVNGSLTHSIGEDLNVTMGYNFVRQLQNSDEVLLGLGEFNRNIAYIRFDYRFKQVPLGR